MTAHATPAGRSVPGPLTDGTAAFPFAAPTIGALGELNYENIAYSADFGYRPLFLDLRVPQQDPGPHPLIIWVHGGGWVCGSRRRLSPNLFANSPHEQMLEAGFAVASVDYRLAREAGFPGMLLDVKAATRWLRANAAEFDLDPERVVIWGESAGGHIAAMAGMCTKSDGMKRTGEYLDESEIPDAVVDWYGPADLGVISRTAFGSDSEESGTYAERPEEMLKGASDWTYAELSPASYVRADVPPIFVAHGVDDSAVPVGQSRDLVEQLRRAGALVDYLEVPAAGHVWRGATSVPDIVEQSLNFVTKVL